MGRVADAFQQLEDIGLELVKALKGSYVAKQEVEGVERDIKSVVALFMVTDLDTQEGQYLLWHLLHDHVEGLAANARFKEQATAFIEASLEIFFMGGLELQCEHLAGLAEKFNIQPTEDGDEG